MRYSDRQGMDNGIENNMENWTYMGFIEGL